MPLLLGLPPGQTAPFHTTFSSLSLSYNYYKVINSCGLPYSKYYIQNRHRAYSSILVTLPHGWYLGTSGSALKVTQGTNTVSTALTNISLKQHDSENLHGYAYGFLLMTRIHSKLNYSVPQACGHGVGCPKGTASGPHDTREGVGLTPCTIMTAHHGRISMSRRYTSNVSSLLLVLMIQL